MIPSLAPYEPIGFQMINEIEIRNFRCFENLSVKECRRFNIIVGDNGAGKTALLEAMFMALTGNVEVSVRLKQQRGFNNAFQGPVKAIEEGIWRDYFHKLDWHLPISINLQGTGAENRSLRISRGKGDVLIPFEGFDQKETGSLAPLQFTWRSADGADHVSTPRVTPQGVQFGVSNEALPDFFFFAANQTVSSSENAMRFSQISRERRAKAFIDVFTREYPWIENLTIEVIGGFPIIQATLTDSDVTLPLNSVSGGVNRILSVMLAVASQSRSVVLVDEMENGLFYKHKVGLWRGILQLGRQHECQMFMTTHDEEWLSSLAEAMNGNVDDVALWRIERLESGKRVVRQFSGETFKDAIEYGADVRDGG